MRYALEFYRYSTGAWGRYKRTFRTIEAAEQAVGFIGAKTKWRIVEVEK